MANPLPATDKLEERRSVVEQFDLSEDTEKSILDQHSEETLATKWEIRAYYACVAFFPFLIQIPLTYR